MTSSFSWLDTSERDRRSAMDVIDLFRRQDTRDELGIGSVRDTISDMLAPGLSTIQTRAKYFLFVPWIYRRLEQQQVSSADIARRARSDELRLAATLAASEDPAGTIGIEAGGNLRRLPSAVYWGGLSVLGIRLFSSHQDQYHRSLDHYLAVRKAGGSGDFERDGRPYRDDNWHPHLPEPPDDFLDEESFRLTGEQAAYLKDRIAAGAHGSLIAFLVGRERPWRHVRYPWLGPLSEQYPASVRDSVEHARCFSETMHGAALLYNLMLAEALPSEERTAQYRKGISDWQARLQARKDSLRKWSRTAFWQLLRSHRPDIPVPTRRFVDDWLEMVIDHAGYADPSWPTRPARNLVARRESRLKGRRARLANREYLEMWSGTAGAAQLSFRWPVAQTIVTDILRGLQTGSRDAAAT